MSRVVWRSTRRQMTVASILIAHVCPPPAATCTLASALAGATATSATPTMNAQTTVRFARHTTASLLGVLGRDQARDAQVAPWTARPRVA